MIYTFGDSFTYGFNFKEDERVASVWPTVLGRCLEHPVTNLAVPGSNNWRIARLVNSLPIQSSDIVVIAWTESTRFEFGVSPTHIQQPNAERIADSIDQDGNVRTKKFFSQIVDRTNDVKAKQLASLAYGEFYNQSWYDEMFLIMFNSVRYRLLSTGCQWIMFNTWTRQYHSECSLLEVPEYMLGYRNTMNFDLRKNGSLEYWNKEEHIQVADKIRARLNEY